MPFKARPTIKVDKNSFDETYSTAVSSLALVFQINTKDRTVRRTDKCFLVGIWDKNCNRTVLTEV